MSSSSHSAAGRLNQAPAAFSSQVAVGTDGAESAGERSDSNGSQRVPVTGEVVVLLLADIDSASRLWGYARFVLGKRPLRGTAGLRFAKVMGSGYEGGFGLRPSGSRQGLFMVFDDEASADAFIERSDLLGAYQSRAREFLVAKLRAISCRGSWDGRRIAVSATAAPGDALAALTRASIRPRRAVEFWRRAPPAQVSLEHAAGCRLAVGLGEAPLLRQATFSVWDSVAAMDAYARTGAHQQAIRASMAGDYFSESMFVRFVPLLLRGTWKGRQFG
jgi:hypothetical protein